MEEIINQLQNLRDLVSEKEKVDNEISHLESNKSAYENVAKKAQDTIDRLMQEFNEGKLIDQSLLINARKEIEENTKSIKSTEKDIDENIELLNKKFQDSKDELIEKIDEEMARYKRKSELDQLRSNKFAYEKVAENAQKTIEKIMQEFNQGKIIDQSLLVNARKEVEENTKKAEEIGKELDGYIELESNIEQYTELEYLKTRTIVLQIEDLKPDLESKFIENNIKEDDIEKQSNKEVEEEEPTAVEEVDEEEKEEEPTVAEEVGEEEEKEEEEPTATEEVDEEEKKEPTDTEEVDEEEKKEPTATEEVDEEEKKEPTATEKVDEEEKKEPTDTEEVDEEEKKEPTATEEVDKEEKGNEFLQKIINERTSEQEVNEFAIDIESIKGNPDAIEDIEKRLNKDGYDNTNFNEKGINKTTGDMYDQDGYDKDGYDKDGYDRYGFNKEGIHRATKLKYNEDGYDKFGFNKNGVHKDTGIEFAPTGFNRNGTPWRVFLKSLEGKQVLINLGITENDIDKIDFEEFVEAYKNPTLNNKKEKDILKEEVSNNTDEEDIIEEDIIEEKPEQQLKVVKENFKDKIIKKYNKAIKKIQELKIASLVKGLFKKSKNISEKTGISLKDKNKKEAKNEFRENLSQEQTETYIKPKYENISEKDKKSILDRLDTFSSQMDNNYEYDETVSGYIGDKAFESFVSDNEYVKSTVIVTDDKLVQIDINKEDSDIGKYKEIKQKDEETKVTFYSDMQASEIITTMEKGNIKLTNTAKEVLYSDDMPEFYTYSIPKDIDKNTYVTVTGLEEEEDLYRLLEGSFAISTEAEKNVDGITKNKTVKYLYTSKQAYINKEQPYMIYVENVDNRQKNAGMFRLLEDGTYIDNNTFTTDGNIYDYETLSLEEINNLIDKENIQIELTSKMDKTIKEGFSIPKEYADIIETARIEESNEEIQLEQK